MENFTLPIDLRIQGFKDLKKDNFFLIINPNDVPIVWNKIQERNFLKEEKFPILQKAGEDTVNFGESKYNSIEELTDIHLAKVVKLEISVFRKIFREIDDLPKLPLSPEYEKLMVKLRMLF